MSGIKYKEDLDRVLLGKCENPDCEGHRDENNGVFLGQKCHTGAGLDVKYLGGYLQIFCSECHSRVAQIAVGNKTEK